MRCLSCSTDFCWLCGQKVSELISDHYDVRFAFILHCAVGL
jgi:hypothetical protein